MKAITKLKKAIMKAPMVKTPVKRAIMASNYIRQYGDPGYVPSNGTGVGGNKNGEPKYLKPLKKIIPLKNKLPLTPIKKKPYTPSNGGYSNFAWY